MIFSLNIVQNTYIGVYCVGKIWSFVMLNWVVRVFNKPFLKGYNA
jgi:hypothetical protein